MRFLKQSFFFLLTLLPACLSAQVFSKAEFTIQDTLRGSLTPERIWWDVVHYDITVQPDFDQHTISGTNTITFKPVSTQTKMQIDLQEPMQIDKVEHNGNEVPFTRHGNVFYLGFSSVLPRESLQKITIHFSGTPKAAKNAPWDGGWIWKKDGKGNPWVSVACQGLGASVWYPNKDHQSDEVDSAALTIVTPAHLKGVGNGRLRSVEKDANGNTRYRWAVTNPINNYNIVPYIGTYTSFGETLQGEKGPLDCTYWVLEEHLGKAKKQFTQVGPMMKCFEHWFGPYPFYEDGYKLVDAPHLGMEHQSAVAYGNDFENGYKGRDLSGSGWGLKFDFIIIHETGHEWFGNNITAKDIADMWIHESFTNYSETIYLNCLYGDSAANAYVQGIRKNIANDIPIIGVYNVNREGSGDMYYKGANMLHMIRQMVGNDEKFRLMLRKMNQVCYHQTVTTAEVEQFLSKETGLRLQKVFDQYLRTTKIPKLEINQQMKRNKLMLSYRWTDCVPGFDMKTRIKDSSGNWVWISPTEKWQKLKTGYTGMVDVKTLKDPNFYIR